MSLAQSRPASRTPPSIPNTSPHLMRLARSSEKSGFWVFTRALFRPWCVEHDFLASHLSTLLLGHVRVHERPRVLVVQVFHEGSAGRAWVGTLTDASGCCGYRMWDSDVVRECATCGIRTNRHSPMQASRKPYRINQDTTAERARQ